MKYELQYIMNLLVGRLDNDYFVNDVEKQFFTRYDFDYK